MKTKWHFSLSCSFSQMRGHRGWRATPEKVSGNGSSEYSTAAEAGTGPARAHLGEGDWTRIWVESCITEIFCTSGLMTLTSVTTFSQPPCLSALQSRKGHLSEEVPNAFLVRRCGESILGSEASGWAHSHPLWQHLAQEPHRALRCHSGELIGPGSCRWSWFAWLILGIN